MQAEDVVVAMGSGCEVAQTAVETLIKQGKKVGLVKVRFKAFDASAGKRHLCQAIGCTASCYSHC